jgi:hypothetical protein
MDREELLEMLGRMAEVPSVELKMNIPADQRMAISGLHLDAMQGRLREVVFFDPPGRAQVAVAGGAGLQEPQGGDGRDPRLLRGVGLPQGEPACRRGPRGDHRRPAAGAAVHQGAAVVLRRARPGRGRLGGRPGAAGSVLVVLLKFVPEGLPNRSTIEQWHYPGQVPLIELSTKATPQNVLQVLADGVRFVRERGLSANRRPGAQDPQGAGVLRSRPPGPLGAGRVGGGDSRSGQPLLKGRTSGLVPL